MRVMPFLCYYFMSFFLRYLLEGGHIIDLFFLVLWVEFLSASPFLQSFCFFV